MNVHIGQHVQIRLLRDIIGLEHDNIYAFAGTTYIGTVRNIKPDGLVVLVLDDNRKIGFYRNNTLIQINAL